MSELSSSGVHSNGLKNLHEMHRQIVLNWNFSSEEEKKSCLVAMPVHIKYYNGNSQPCDLLIGPCCCGAWHTEADWKGKIPNL